MARRVRATEQHHGKIAQKGNSPGVTFPRHLLESAGMNQEDRVVMTATKGRIVVAREDSDYTRAMEIYERVKVRYKSALAKLAT